MNDIDPTVARGVAFFGDEGHRRLRHSSVAVVGIGGIGTLVVQQLALLRIGTLIVIDGEDVEETNRNRYVGVLHDDPIPGTPKVEVARRLVAGISPETTVVAVKTTVVSSEAFDALEAASYIFGCIDNDAVRVILTEFAAAFGVPYIDAATEIVPDADRLRYGGRVAVAWDGNGCLSCLGELDHDDVRKHLASESGKLDEEAIYGAARTALGGSGPSVGSINGVVASLAVVEFMLAVTGIRPANRLLRYRADIGTITRSSDAPLAGCYYCAALRGRGAAAPVVRSVRDGFRLS